MEPIKLGLKENWQQFTLLVIVNGFVGGMVGLERSILPQIAEQEFAIVARTAILSFIVIFGITKALTNYYTGSLADRFGRKRLLVAGWIIGIPIPFMLMFAPDWNWIIAANVLLGINQGLTWSSTVVMKIDIVGEKKRGLAMGINESAGYISVALVSFLTGWIAGTYGLRPYPFSIGIVIIFSGLLLSIFFVKDTRHHVRLETANSTLPRLKNIFRETTWKNRNLGSVTQAGLINNLNDGMAWGIFPILLATKGFTLPQIGFVAAVYPAIWGIGQLLTGKLSDILCKKDLLYAGMMLQAIALVALLWGETFFHFVALSCLLGWGTAMVYPTFLASIAENTHPLDRAKSIGIFRLWRDLGYAIGAILTGIIADLISINASIFFIGLLTMISSLIIQNRMKCMDNNALKLWQWIFNYKKSFVEINNPCFPGDELKSKLGSNVTFQLIDVRSKEEYEQQHIPGAIHIGLDQLEQRAKTLNSKVKYVTVCGKGGGRSADAAAILNRAGFQAWWLCGGTFGWSIK
jgi:MFS family permease